MESWTAFLALVVGLMLRLVIPIGITCVVIYFLRKLDDRWQAEASQQAAAVSKPECWKIKECPPEQRDYCIGFSSPLPCWQAFRKPNGHLKEECLSCKVFRDARVPNIPRAAPISIPQV